MREILKSLNQRPIAYYPAYRKLTGSTTAGILLSQLMYWFGKQDKIYKTDKEIIEETLLTENELRSAKTAIKKLDFINVTREGLPAKTYYEIDWNMYETTLVKSAKQDELNSRNSTSEIHETVPVKSTKHYKEKHSYNTETTTETTTKSVRENTLADETFEEPEELQTFHNTENGYKLFINYLKKIAPIKSKITSTKAGLDFYKTINDKEKLINDYIAHQREKREFAIRITAFMEDYNSFILPQQAMRGKVSDKVQQGLGAVEAFLADDSIGGAVC